MFRNRRGAGQSVRPTCQSVLAEAFRLCTEIHRNDLQLRNVDERVERADTDQR